MKFSVTVILLLNSAFAVNKKTIESGPRARFFLRFFKCIWLVMTGMVLVMLAKGAFMTGMVPVMLAMASIMTGISLIMTVMSYFHKLYSIHV